MNLTNKLALITGAAHRVGKGIAISLAEQGCDIIVHYGRSEEKARQTVEELKDYGIDAIAISADLRNEASILQLFDKLQNNFSRLDIVVNSAATFKKGDFNELKLSDWDTSMNINLRAPFFIIQQAVPLINETPRNGESGLIVNISDLSGMYPWQKFTAHGVSKAGLIHLTKSAARELAPSIRVNCVVPGPILPPSGMKEEDPVWQEIIENVPLKKSGDPSNIGDTIVFFAENDYINGSILRVDGGEGLVGAVNH